MTEEFLTFRRFPDKESANDFSEELTKAGIGYRVESVPTTLDSVYIGEAANPMFSVKIASSDFEKANTVLNEYYKKVIETIDKDYYLFSFSDTELLEIVAKPDEWGHLDFQLAQKILEERGQPIDTVTLDRLKENRIVELTKPEKDAWGLLVIGYLLIAAGLFFLFVEIGFVWGVYGIPVSSLIGSLLTYNKKVLPDGKKVYSYSAESRKHGKIIFITSIILICFYVVSWLKFQRVE